MPASAELLHPDVLGRIASLELRATRVVAGFLSGMHRSRYKGHSVEFAGHRSYVQGDELRHIDWRVYARADRHFVKEHEVETNMRLNLLVDGSASMAYPQHADGRMTKWIYACTVAASLASLLLNQQDAVGLTLFDSTVRRQLPWSTRGDSLGRLCHYLEAHVPAGRTDAAPLFSELVERAPRKGMIILISDLMTELDPLFLLLRQFAHQHRDVIVLQVLDHDEIELPFADRVLFEGLEEPDVRLMADVQSLRKTYLEALGEHLRLIRKTCQDLRIEYALFSTADRLDAVLTRFLAYRKHRIRSGA